MAKRHGSCAKAIKEMSRASQKTFKRLHFQKFTTIDVINISKFAFLEFIVIHKSIGNRQEKSTKTDNPLYSLKLH